MHAPGRRGDTAFAGPGKHITRSMIPAMKAADSKTSATRGKAAAAHGSLADAIAILEKVPDASSLKPDARLLQGKIL